MPGNSENMRNKLKDLESLWSHHQIPEDIRNIYRELLSSVSYTKLKSFLLTEIENLKNDSSLILICLNGILAREDSIRSIKLLNSNLANVHD